MKNVFLFLCLLLPLTAFADNDRHEHRYERYERYERNNQAKFGWGEFVGGVIIGGVIAHEIGKNHNNNDPVYRQITVCNDYILRDRWGDPIFDERGFLIKERRCHQEWVQVRE